MNSTLLDENLVESEVDDVVGELYKAIEQLKEYGLCEIYLGQYHKLTINPLEQELLVNYEN
jgi:hypothetical protein